MAIPIIFVKVFGWLVTTYSKHILFPKFREIAQALRQLCIGTGIVPYWHLLWVVVHVAVAAVVGVLAAGQLHWPVAAAVVGFELILIVVERPMLLVGQQRLDDHVSLLVNLDPALQMLDGWYLQSAFDW